MPPKRIPRKHPKKVVKGTETLMLRGNLNDVIAIVGERARRPANKQEKIALHAYQKYLEKLLAAGPNPQTGRFHVKLRQI